jgi:hypothetical protein
MLERLKTRAWWLYSIGFLCYAAWRLPWVVLPVAAALAAWIGSRNLLDNRRFRTRGYRIGGSRDWITYEERVTDTTSRSIQFYRDLGSPSALYVPSDAAWDDKVPEWARGRRTTILARVKAQLGSSHVFENA